MGRRDTAPLQKSSRPFKTGHPERWPSGLRRTLGKRVCGKLYRGFESHSLRQLAQGCIFSPKLLRHHERPAASSAVGQGNDFDCQTVPRAAETVSLALELHSIVGPAREFETRVSCAQEHVEHPEEGRALQAFHTADLPANEALACQGGAAVSKCCAVRSHDGPVAPWIPMIARMTIPPIPIPRIDSCLKFEKPECDAQFEISDRD